MKNNIIKTIKEYVLIIIGTMLMAAGVVYFKVPNGFVTGGVSGIGTVLGKVLPFLSPGIWISLLNIILLLFGFIFLGKSTGLRTCICTILFSVFTMVLEWILPMTHPFTNQPLLELIYAMALTSAGAAIVFNYNASAGGTDVIALILKKYTNINVGTALLFSDFFVACTSFFALGMEAGLFSMLGLFAKAFLVDTIIENINSYKYFIAITDKPDIVCEYIHKGLHHGATLHEATGTYTDNKKYMVHTVCRRLEAIKLKREIKSIDPGSFIIVTTTSEIIGRGFRQV